MILKNILPIFKARQYPNIWFIPNAHCHVCILFYSDRKFVYKRSCLYIHALGLTNPSHSFHFFQTEQQQKALHTPCIGPYIDLQWCWKGLWSCPYQSILICSIKSVRISTGRRYGRRHCARFDGGAVPWNRITRGHAGTERMSITFCLRTQKGWEPRTRLRRRRQEEWWKIVAKGVVEGGAKHFLHANRWSGDVFIAFCERFNHKVVLQMLVMLEYMFNLKSKNTIHWPYLTSVYFSGLTVFK